MSKTLEDFNIGDLVKFSGRQKRDFGNDKTIVGGNLADKIYTVVRFASGFVYIKALSPLIISDEIKSGWWSNPTGGGWYPNDLEHL